MKRRRIASLLPSATEIVCALGAEDQLVGVSHECDFPATVSALPLLTRSIVPAGLSSREIDERVSSALRQGESLYELELERLNELEPDVVITQALCDVCAINFESVARAVAKLRKPAELVSLNPGCIQDILADTLRVGIAIGAEPAAQRLLADAQARLARLSELSAALPRVRVLTLEWFDPPFYGGHWVPEQVALAGGESLFGQARERSQVTTWPRIEQSDPDAILLMPCGYDTGKTCALLPELERVPAWNRLRAVQAGRVFALDANSYFSRPGPRVVAGAEILAHLLHPDVASAPEVANTAWRRIQPARASELRTPA